jgi:hypothetical protein
MRLASAIIEQTEKECGFAFPDDYKDLLLRQNGGQGFIGLNYAMLW